MDISKQNIYIYVVQRNKYVISSVYTSVLSTIEIYIYIYMKYSYVIIQSPYGQLTILTFRAQCL